MPCGWYGRGFLYGTGFSFCGKRFCRLAGLGLQYARLPPLVGWWRVVFVCGRLLGGLVLGFLLVFFGFWFHQFLGWWFSPLVLKTL